MSVDFSYDNMFESLFVICFQNNHTLLSKKPHPAFAQLPSAALPQNTVLQTVHSELSYPASAFEIRTNEYGFSNVLLRLLFYSKPTGILHNFSRLLCASKLSGLVHHPKNSGIQFRRFQEPEEDPKENTHKKNVVN